MSDQGKEIIARDEHAAEFDSWYLKRGFYYDWVEKKTIMNALNLKSEDIVLDVGCGTGRFTRMIAKKCRKVYGIDFSPKSVEVLKEKAKEEGLKNIEPFICDITKPLPIKEKVDKIISVQVVQHIPTATGRKIALKNLYNQLNPNGRCVISVYNWSPLINRGLLKEGKFINGICYSRFTPIELEALLRTCGFKNISVGGCINFKWYNIFKNSDLQQTLYPVAKIDAFLSKFRVSCSLGNFLVCKGIK